MSTTELNCTNCNVIFTKSNAEIARRRYKTDSPNWFCCLSCSAQYSNKHRAYQPTSPKPQYGNQHNRRYTEGYLWYVTRVLNDSRVSKRLDESKTTRQEFAEHIESVFSGKCVYSNRDITLAPLTDSTDPFEIASLDRIDCTLRYDIGNVQWTSRAMNLARQAKQHDEFLKMTEWLRV